MERKYSDSLMFNTLRKALDNIRAFGPVIGANEDHEVDIPQDSVYWSLGEEDKKMLRGALGKAARGMGVDAEPEKQADRLKAVSLLANGSGSPEIAPPEEEYVDRS